MRELCLGAWAVFAGQRALMAETWWQCQGQGEMAAIELPLPAWEHPRVIQGPILLHPNGGDHPGGRNGVSVPQLWPQEVCDRDRGITERQSQVLL